MTRIDPTTLAKAREWVEKDFVTEAHFRAAAEVIDALPDTIVDGDKLREITRNVEAATPGFPAEYQGKLRTWARRLNALLPDPAPRTLADMTREEREACQWMQADFDDGMLVTPARVVITKARKTTADIILPEGATRCVSPDKLTPLPDLPRMAWPDAHHPATDAEDTK